MKSLPAREICKLTSWLGTGKPLNFFFKVYTKREKTEAWVLPGLAWGMGMTLASLSKGDICADIFTYTLSTAKSYDLWTLAVLNLKRVASNQMGGGGGEGGIPVTCHHSLSSDV